MRLIRLYSFLVLAPAFVLPCVAQDDLESLRRQIAAQQKQIEELQRTLKTQQQALDRLAGAAAAPTAPTAPPAPLVASISTAAIGTAAAQQSKMRQAPVSQSTTEAAPLSWRIGTAEFTPGGFMDMTSIFRTTNVGSGIGTTFGSIPFNVTAAGKTTENTFSTQNSRLSMKVTANAGSVPITGYVESDFLGAFPTNGHVSSNSDSFRLRVYWANVRPGKWEILGGQSWSMLTPGRTGISPMPSDLFFTQNMDTNYQVGLTWTRAPQFRVVYHANNGLHAGFALENPNQYTNNAVLPAFAVSQVDTSSTQNPGTPNLHPDVQTKIAYDKKPGGRAFHIEAAGVFRSFKIQRATGNSATTHGGAGELNMNFELVKNFRVLATSYYGSGGGRYIFGLGPDFIVRQNGDISPIKSGSGIAGFEYQASRQATLFAYYGLAYFGRSWGIDSKGNYVGYGFPGSPSSNNRTIKEYTAGYIHTIWKNPNYGALQIINQYSYLERTPWAVPAAGPFHAHTHMLYNDLRYVLP
jgi:uncharacterized coiled-coil protein SlyX